ncbi:hypothetical protein KZP23_18040 [Echinicola marina]|uniref:hypothetical protein n=1 Tax=Echinicola marina TaxID=2859768 RepID=UPI001CF6BB8D|nr:hypothetical protein [Echinicola marina]UCS92574.1 hypothetical protein KZP23_18040 [Echinicola marina]
MQESWKFKLKNTHSGPKDLIRETILKEKKEWNIFISLYAKLDGAIAEDISLKEIKSMDTDLTGTIILAFKKIFYNACLNIHEQDKDKIELDYQIDTEKDEIVFTGPLIPERGMDDI